MNDIHLKSNYIFKIPQNKRYTGIMRRLQQTRKEWAAGKMEDLMKLEGVDRKKALRTKSISLNGRGMKAVDETTKREKILLGWLEERWNLEQRVSRTMILRKVLEIYPKFCGGINSNGYLERM